MFRAMDLSDVQVISPSRNRTHKIFFQRDNHVRSNYRKLNGRTFVDMEVVEYPEFGTYFCPLENNETDNKRYFIRFSKYNKYFPEENHNIKLSYEIKKGNDDLHKTPYFLIYIFFNKNQEWIRFNIDVDSISRICLGENNNNEIRKYPSKKREQTIYFYLKYPPKIGHKKPGENSSNLNNDISNIEDEKEPKMEDELFDKNNYAKSVKKNHKKLGNYNLINNIKSKERSISNKVPKKKLNFDLEKPEIEINKNKININNINIVNKNNIIVSHEKEFFFNRFRKELQKYDYKNHNHYLKEENKIKESSNSIKIAESNENLKNKDVKDKRLFVPRSEMKTKETNDFIRLDSFLSVKNEYSNFYLLNLVMKIKVRYSNLEEFSDLFYEKLKLKEKSILNFTDFLYEPDEVIYTKAKAALELYRKSFYTYLVNLHFSLQYSILAFITTRKLNLFNYVFFKKIMKGFNILNCEDQETMSKALDQLTTEAIITNDLTTLIGSRYNELKNKAKEEKDNNIEIKENISYMRSVEITPSLIYYEVPKLERNNQIIRKFKQYQEHFIKISINDDDHNKIYFASSKNSQLLVIVQSLMTNGLNIGTHHFNYLTSSNSQAKQGSGWYFNLEFTKYENIDKVLEEMGNFKQEQNKYKNASRRGQCASSTTPINFLPKENIREIPDIKSSDNKYIYTDGIGTISYDLAMKCVDKIGNKKFSYCSAFQIRLLGIKGVVAVDPNLEDKDIICIRPSMKKYESENNELGIIKSSGYSTGYLNRQIIALLNGLGVRNNIFISMIKVSLKEYQTILKYIRNKSTELSSYFKANKDVYNEVLSKCFYFKSLVDYYLFKRNKRYLPIEPFIQKILLNCLSIKIRDLKSKGKIIDKQSASLMGVIDETRTLKHNEVFVRIFQPFAREDEQDFTLEGEVYVTKNPCLHPGDIKILKAVNNEDIYKKLNHMINVIVFSSLEDENDKRPVQNQISGGDLDGDIYYVSWNKDIIDGIIKRNVPPQEDPKYPSQLVNNNNGNNNNNLINNNTISMNDVILSHINTMKNDLVPLISNLYLAHADNDLIHGPFNEKCKILSDLFMIAIDSQKNGKFISQEILSEQKLLLNTYPDFLETDSYKSYKSPGILGILYRLCNEKEFLDEFDYYEYTNSYLMSYYLDLELFDEKCLPYTHQMLKIYIKYENDLKGLMLKYNFTDEVSFFFNVDLRNTKNNKKIRDVPPFKEIELLQKKYKNIILNKYKEVTIPIAKACYLVTYMNVHMEKGRPQLFKLNPEGKKFVDEWKKSYLNKYQKVEFSNYEAFKEKTKGMDLLKFKKMFSFPWLIKEVREVLFSIGVNYGYNNGGNEGKNGNGYYYGKDNGFKKYKGNRFNFMNG